jgi:hypothetical protein
MTSRYNSYAAKIYAEHPLALWALDENTESATPQTVSNIGNLGSISVVEAVGHTGSTPKGYYINPGELSRNTSVPLVFGAYNSTTIYDGSVGVYEDSEDLPSIIIPSEGFLLERGRYYSLTVEFWANISNRSSTPKRIFGPIGSSDGLYAEGPFLGLKIDKNYSSHYVGTWGRPMLIQISIIRNLATVIINGATVISMSIDTDSISLSPDQLENGNSLDWLGFYATAETSPTQIDCIAIYAYMVTDIIAKQRFVYGQGTQSVDTIFNSYTSTPISIDYSFSNFGKNRTYPDLFRWENGDIENLETDLGRLAPPNYSLPNILITGKTLQEWKNLQFGEGREHFALNYEDLSPANSYSGYLVFNNLNVTKDPFRGFYGVFASPSLVEESQILFRVENEQSREYFEIVLSSDEDGKHIEYWLNENKLNSEPLLEELYSDSDKFSVGIDLDNSLKGESFNQINNLFTDKTNSKIFIGGYPTAIEDRSNFYGEVYRVGFYTSANHERLTTIVESPISDEGYFEQDSWSELKDYVASYTLIPQNSLGFFELDIAISGYWENSISLSSIAKAMSDGSIELDYFQFNIDYPEPELLTIYDIYGDTLYRNTSEEILKSYLIFKQNQGISDPISWGDENDIYPLPEESVIVPTESYIDKKIEVCDGTIVYAPEIEGESFLDYSFVVRLEFEVDGILSKPIKVRSLEIASRSLEESSENPIGTKFGKQIFPYVKEGTEKNYKEFNPVSISKSRSNYLYLTKTTGIGLAGTYDENRKISFDVNRGKSSFYEVATLQFAMNYPYNNFEASELAGEDVLLFEIVGSGESHYRIYADFSSLYGFSLGELYVVSVSSGVEQLSPETRIFLNGVESVAPIVRPGEWYFVGIQFEDLLNFNGVTGEVAMSGPARFDNVSLYLIAEAELNSKTVFSFWSTVDGTEETPRTWGSYYSDNDVASDDAVWEDLFIGEGTFTPGITPFSVYNTYIGSNSIIADSYSIEGNTSNIIFEFKDYEYRVKTDINFEQKIATPL